MEYSLNIQGMHCKGCASLIQISLEDLGVKTKNIDVKSGTAVIEYLSENQDDVKSIVDKVFSDLPGYSFSDLTHLT